MKKSIFTFLGCLFTFFILSFESAFAIPETVITILQAYPGECQTLEVNPFGTVNFFVQAFDGDKLGINEFWDNLSFSWSTTGGIISAITASDGWLGGTHYYGSSVKWTDTTGVACNTFDIIALIDDIKDPGEIAGNNWTDDAAIKVTMHAHVTPEPSTCLLLCFGLVGLIGVKKKFSL